MTDDGRCVQCDGLVLDDSVVWHSRLYHKLCAPEPLAAAQEESGKPEDYSDVVKELRERAAEGEIVGTHDELLLLAAAETITALAARPATEETERP